MKFVEGIIVHPKVRSILFLMMFLATILAKNIIRNYGDSVFSALQPLPSQDKTQSTAFLGALWALSAQSMQRKAIDLRHQHSSELYLPLAFKNVKMEEQFKAEKLLQMSRLEEQFKAEKWLSTTGLSGKVLTDPE